jgi:hypothetical protein
MRIRVLGALAVADFLERTRRPGYLVTLAAAVLLGYLALPPASSRWVVMNAGGYRGVYNSAWAGTVTALAGALWLMGAGFYVVRSAIERDRQTGVGQILAATPLRNAGYLAGKFLSNLMVLASMAAVLAVTALAMQLARGESRSVGLGALLLPYALFTLPVLVLTAAAAVLAETIPGLRGGLGNIGWFFVWMVFAISGGGVPLGFGPARTSMRLAMAAQHLRPAEFSVGFTQVEHPLQAFAWPGLAPSGGFVAARLVVIAVGCCLAIGPAAWFGRFDPARDRGWPRGRARGRGRAALGEAPAPDPVPQPSMNVALGRMELPHIHIHRRPAAVPGVAAPFAGPAAGAAPAVPAVPAVYRPLPRTGAGPRRAFGRLLAGEVRILVQGTSRWWWLAAAAVNVAGLAVPASLVKPAGASTALLLSAAWIWPVLIWSRLGTQRRENGLETLLGSYPAACRQLAAEWAAGLVLTAFVGLGPLLRMALAADGPRVTAWLAGALFIPALALLLGTATRTHRTFQVLYVLLWYAAVNQVAAADYMGTVLAAGRPAGPSALSVAGAGAVMLVATFTIRAARHAAR